jgi:hypothetical protein
MEQGRKFAEESRHATGIDLFRQFLYENDSYWPQKSGTPGEHRQQRKLRERLAITADSLQGDRASTVDWIINVALARASDRPPPIYVMGLGGSGSHWLAKLIASAVPSATYLTEVYIPSRLYTEMSDLSSQEQGFVVDCIHIAHTLPHDHESLPAARFVNPAAGRQCATHRRWDPRCFVVHLIRDPREQVMSVTFRKSVYREEQFPTISDEEYLIDRAVANAQNYFSWRSATARPDYTCRYENLTSSAASTLEQIVATMGEDVCPDAIQHAAHEYDSNLMRKGVVPHRGNLSSFASRSWRKDATEHQRAILHAHLVEVVVHTCYPLDDCLGTPLALKPCPVARRLQFGDATNAGAVFIRGGTASNDNAMSWTRLGDTSGPLTVPADMIAKLRVHEATSEEAIAEMIALLPQNGVESLCLAGNENLSNHLLEFVLECLPGLRELDISRTPVTNDAAASIERLSHLEGLSALETRMSDLALTELSRTGPPVVAMGRSVVGNRPAFHLQ